MNAVSIHLRRIGDTLRIYAQFVNTTGSAAAATSVTWRIYKEADGTAVANDTMTAVDGASAVGLYRNTSTITMSGGSWTDETEYVVRVTGTIDGETPAAISTFRIGFDGPVLVRGTADSGSTSTVVDTERTEADTDYWKGAIILFTSGNIQGQARLITAFNAATDTITFAPVTTQAVSTHTYVILPGARSDLHLWKGSVANDLISGRVESHVGAMTDGVITAAAVATGAIDADAIADNAIDAGAIADGAIDAATFAAGAINAAAIADGAIDAATFAAGAINAAAIAADAIGASELAADAVAEIQAGLATTAAVSAVAGDVWEEERAAHVTAGSFGQGVASVQGNVTGSVASVIGSVGSIGPAGITAGSFASSAIDAAAIATDAIGALEFSQAAADKVWATAVRALTDKDGFRLSSTGVDDIWDENIVSAHGTADTSGLILSQLTKRAVTLGAEVLDGSIVGQIVDDGVATYDRTTDSLQAIRDAIPAGAPSVGDIADAVWDELMSGHAVVGSFGQRLQPARAGTAAGGGASSITLDAGASATSNFYNGMICLITGSTGAVQARVITAYSGVSKIATLSPAWTTAPGAGSEFVLIPSIGAGGVAAAVWDEARALHAVGGSFGEGIASVQGNVTGSVGSVTGNVGGNVNGNVVGSVGSVLGNLGGDVLGDVVGDVQGNVLGFVASVAAGGITALSIAMDAIDADALAVDAVAEIQAGLATAAALALVQADTDDIQMRLPLALVDGRMDSSVGAMAANVITAAALAADAGEEIIAAVSGTADAGSTALTIVDAARTEADADYWKDMLVFVTGGAAVGQVRRISAFNPATDTLTVDTAFTQAIAAGDTYLILRTAILQAGVAGATDWTAGERSQIRQALGVTGAVVATDGTGDLKTLAAAIQADTDDLQARVPATLIGGRMRSHVELMDTDTLTAAALAADAVAEIVAAIPAGATPAAIATAVWQALKTANQGETIMGNIAQDSDNQEFTGKER